MFQFNNYEKIERSLLRISKNLEVKNVVLLGKKNSRDEKIEPHYERSYDSSKYSNYSKLSQISIDTQDYLVFKYSDRKNKNYEEIYLSYPHIPHLIKQLKFAQSIIKNEVVHDDEPVEVFFETDEGIFLNREYEDLRVNIDRLIFDKVISIEFDVIVHDREGMNESKGAIFYMNDSGYGAEVSEMMLDGLVYFLDRFNLVTSSELIYNTALLTLSSHKSESSSESNRVPNTVKSKVKSTKKKITRKFKNNSSYSTPINDMFGSSSDDEEDLPFEESEEEEEYKLTDEEQKESEEEIPEWLKGDDDEETEEVADKEDGEFNGLDDMVKGNSEYEDETDTIVNLSSIAKYSE